MGDMGGIHSRENGKELRGWGGVFKPRLQGREIVGRDNSMC